MPTDYMRREVITIVSNRLAVSVSYTFNNRLFADDCFVRVEIENIGENSEWIYMPGLSTTVIRVSEPSTVDGPGLPLTNARDQRGGVDKNWVLLQPAESFSRWLKEFPTHAGALIVKGRYSNQESVKRHDLDCWRGQSSALEVTIPIVDDPDSVRRAMNVLKREPDNSKRASTALALGEMNASEAIGQLVESMLRDTDIWVRVQSLRALQRLAGMPQSAVPEVEPKLREREQNPDRIIKLQQRFLQSWLDERSPKVMSRVKGRYQ